MKEYRKRIIDELLELNMEAFGATWIRGPKGCGKTTTARINGEGYIPEYTRTKLTDRLHTDDHNKTADTSHNYWVYPQFPLFQLSKTGL